MTPKVGVYLMNVLSVSKIAILLFVVITGCVVLSGKTHIKDPLANFRNIFSGSSHSSNDYATATFKVLDAYAGWEGINYVMNNVRNPVQTLKIAGPLGLGICAVLYMLANIAYFAGATKDQIRESGVTVAVLFFKNVFGTRAEKALSVIVALSALGNVITVTFASCRVNQELAKEGIPLPFGNKFWASNWPTGKSPLPGLIIHLIPSVRSPACVSCAPERNTAPDNCHHCTPSRDYLPFYTGRRRISAADYQPLHRRWSFLAEMEEAERSPSIQGLDTIRTILSSCSRLSNRRTFPSACKSRGRHAPTAILLILPRRNRGYVPWCCVLGCVAYYAALHIWLHIGPRKRYA